MNTVKAVVLKVKFTFDVNGKVWDVAYNQSTGLWYVNEVLSDYKVVAHRQKDSSYFVEAQKVLQWAVECKSKLHHSGIVKHNGA